MAQAVLMGLLNRHFNRPAIAFNLIPTDKDWLDSYKSDNPGKTFTPINYQDLANMAVQSGMSMSKPQGSMHTSPCFRLVFSVCSSPDCASAGHSLPCFLHCIPPGSP